jgi:hypothetical protein
MQPPSAARIAVGQSCGRLPVLSSCAPGRPSGAAAAVQQVRACSSLTSSHGGGWIWACPGLGCKAGVGSRHTATGAASEWRRRCTTPLSGSRQQAWPAPRRCIRMVARWHPRQPANRAEQNRGVTRGWASSYAATEPRTERPRQLGAQETNPPRKGSKRAQCIPENMQACECIRIPITEKR